MTVSSIVCGLRHELALQKDLEIAHRLNATQSKGSTASFVAGGLRYEV
jgi:hypothetical protein